MPRETVSPLRRLLPIVIAVGMLAFAIEGGEYGTRDLVRQRERRARLTAQIDSVQRVVDSLRRYRDLVQKDPRLQERLAREEFGMVRGDRELLYRFTDPDTATRARH